MAKAYLIGGPSRTGKTNLALSLIAEQPMLAASTDALRYTLRRLIKEIDAPKLFGFQTYISNDPATTEYLRSHAAEAVEAQNRESVIVWQSAVDFIHSNLEDGFDVLIEGIAVLPELVAQLDCNYSAVFIGNQSEAHVQTILDYARSNNSDWMHELEDETIAAFATFNQALSRHFENEAAKHGMAYIEVHDDSFKSDMETALKTLLQ